MAYTDKNGIQFTTFDGNGSAIGNKIQNVENKGVSINDLAAIAQDNGGELPSIINALEIDWNGAKPGIGEDNNGIQSTGELLALLKQMNNNIKQLQSAVVTISNAVIVAVANTN